MYPVEQRRFLAGLAAILVLAALTVASLTFVSPPAPVPASAPSDQFSAERAYVHVDRIGQKVHVAGSEAAAEVRDYIVSQLAAMGLQPQIQDAVGGTGNLGGFALARVRNVIAVLPGQSSGDGRPASSGADGKVFLVAHYDSVQVSYGGSDDGAGVATLLETARAIKAGPKPRNDIVFVFTEAEEACLCGAEAFVSQSPLARDGGVVLNFEARGSSGPAIMFETSADNAGVVGVYGQSVPYPVATSFAVEVYRILPNDTDFTLFRKSGRFTGLNTAYIDGSAVYHSPEDRPSYMDKASLQHHGSNALALTRSFAAADLTVLAQPSTEDTTYFPVLGQLVRYPGWLVWPLAVLALLAVAGLSVLAVRRRVATGGRIAGGFGLALIPLLLAPVLTQVLWLILTLIRPGYANMLDPWRPGWFRLGVVALVATVLLTWYGLLRKRFGPWALAIGALGWLAVLGLVFAAVTPGGSYLTALPALVGAFAGAGALLLRGWFARLLVLTVGVAVAVVILAPTVLLFFPALGLAEGGAAALFAVLLGLAALPVLEWVYPPEGVRRRLFAAGPAVLAGVVTVAFVATGLAVDRFDEAHPAPTQLMYALDADTNTAYWASADSSPLPWARQYVSTKQDLSGKFPLLSKPLLAGPADAADLTEPSLTVTADQTFAGKRSITVLIKPQRQVRLAYLKVVSDQPVARAVADGRQLPDDQVGPHASILFHAPPPQGLSVSLLFDGTGPVTLRVLDGSDGLSNLPGFQPRPAGVGVEGSHTSELVLVGKTYTV
jgi:hypothetical protein